jgi:uroporphyrinogen-III synthase
MPRQSFLLTRPAAASERFAALLRESFGPELPIVISPLMAPVFLHPALPAGRFGALILTSETGVEAARRISAEGVDLPAQAFCVGDRTTRMAQEAGFAAISAKGDADALIRLIGQDAKAGRMLHLRGADTRGDIVQRLESMGISAQEAVVYSQQSLALTLEATKLLAGEQPVILPLFSPRSADLMVTAGPFDAPLWIAALSPAVAERAAVLHPDRLTVATQPEAAALVQAIECLRVAGSRT